MKYRGYCVTLCAFVFALSARAQESDESVATIDADDLAPEAEEACFLVRDARNFDALTDRFIYVEGRRDEHYLLTMFPGCSGLRGSIGIAIASSVSRVCSNTGSQVRFRAFGRRDSCPIIKVESIDSEESAERIAELRTNSR